MAIDIIALKDLSSDILNGKVKNYAQCEDALRKEIIDICGGKWGQYTFFENKYKIFQILSETITDKVNRLTEEAFSDFCDVENFDLGNKKEFTVKNTDLLRIANIAEGKNSTRRQRLLGKKVPTSAFKLAIAIYEEFDRFIAGRIDWSEMVDRVSSTFQHHIAEAIASTMEGAYTSVHTNLKTSAAYSDKDLKKIVNKVKGATGQSVAIYGTPEAVGNIEGVGADLDKDDKRNFGYVKNFSGTPVIELPNYYDTERDKWALSNNILYVIPNDEKIIKLGFEGDTMIIENTDGTVRDDQQIEMFMSRKMHLGVVVASKFGMYKIQ